MLSTLKKYMSYTQARLSIIAGRDGKRSGVLFGTSWMYGQKKSFKYYCMWYQLECHSFSTDTSTSTICDFNVPRGVALFQKYGPNARLIIQILMNPSKEDEYLYDVQARVTKLAHNFSTIFSDHENLNFSFDEIFILKPDLLVSRQSPILTIPTAFLFITLGIAVSRQTMALKQCFFTTLRDHPHLGSPAGWLFKNYAHICFSAPNYTPFVGYLPNDPNPHTISTARQIITGSTKLKNIQGPFNFYWQPREPHFPGVDAIIRSGDIVWALQFTISSSHKPATEGLNWLYKVMNHKTDVDWRLVIVGPDLDVAKSARDQQNLTVRWGKINIYACELPLGCFDEDKLQQLQVNLNKVSTHNTFFDLFIFTNLDICTDQQDISLLSISELSCLRHQQN